MYNHLCAKCKLLLLGHRVTALCEIKPDTFIHSPLTVVL